MKRYWTLAELSRRLGITYSTLHDAAREGWLPVQARADRYYLFTEDKLPEILASLVGRLPQERVRQASLRAATLALEEPIRPPKRPRSAI